MKRGAAGWLDLPFMIGEMITVAFNGRYPIIEGPESMLVQACEHAVDGDRW